MHVLLFWRVCLQAIALNTAGVLLMCQDMNGCLQKMHTKSVKAQCNSKTWVRWLRSPLALVRKMGASRCDDSSEKIVAELVHASKVSAWRPQNEAASRPFFVRTNFSGFLWKFCRETSEGTCRLREFPLAGQHRPLLVSAPIVEQYGAVLGNY